ncbi:MAG: serine hydrolase [Balneola sp.]
MTFKNYRQFTRILFSVFTICFCFAPVSKSEAQSADSSTLEAIFKQADDIETVRSLIIQQNNNLLKADSFDGRELDRAFNIKSASKSIIGLLTGIAISEGFIPSVDEPIKTYFPDYFEENPDSLKEFITVGNLLSMQAGLRSTSSRNYGAWVISKNWVEYALDQDFVNPIGGEMVYSTGTSHLLSVIISKASGMNTRAFAREYLFDPMNISIGGWDKDPQGNYMGGNNMALKPLDLVKIGQLILDNGEYDGEQLISRQWIRDSFKTYTYSNYNPYGYGYHWWNQELGGYKVFFAWGNGGQYIFMIPELTGVVVITSSTYNTDPSRSYKEPIFELLENELIPFLSRRTNKD